MASIVLQSAGAAIGGYFGGAAGAAIGAQVGGYLGSAIEGGNKTHYEGQRLEDLAVQTSTYGRMIPMVFGSVRIAGNVIWSRPIKEIATTTKSSAGGKGSGGQKSSSSTTYSYYVTLAVAICEGEVTRVDRVWADAQLLDLSQGTYRIYTGSETQLPDPMIESYEGVGTTPAYRGMSYIVIEDFPMSDFGNRIPNFTFEVTRQASQLDDGTSSVESQIKSIMLIPGSGEFVYDTQTEYKLSGETVGGQFVQNGYQFALNQHTADGRANVMLALDQLQQTLPNLEWVGVVVNWFGTTMNINDCEIYPCVEYQGGVLTSPDDWQVAGFTRSTARLIGNDAGVIRYGGTPDDGSMVRLLTELRARGLKIFFYPMMLMDVAGKPWRGNLTGSAGDVSNFFSRSQGYTNFITHYANLVAGKVDAFAIGSEMRDLTKITSSAGVFPAVSQLVTLAGSVKTILGSSVKITYAADWSEYHHTDGGWYHLDPLWMSPNIDVVGIDAYFPLSDEVQTVYDIDAIKDGWTSGEDYDWYYTDVARTTQASLPPAYAAKNIEWWWNNSHVNPGGAATAWTPQAKPIWFTEYGFASVDGCANQPNVFIDSTTAASAYPRFSRGRIDFMAQRTAIAATEAKWGDNSVVSRRFLWTWDARPYPYWPDLTSVWADGGNWVTGHWVQGKLGASHVAAVVRQIAARAGFDSRLIDVNALQIALEGFVISNRTTARAAIEQLMQAYFFSIKESDGKLIAIARDAQVDAVIAATATIPIHDKGQDFAYKLMRQEDMVLPQTVEVHSLNRLQSYQTQVSKASRGVGDAHDIAALRVSLVLSDTHGRSIAETLLADKWAQRISVEFQLPMHYAALEPSDVVTLVDGNVSYRLRINQIQIGKPGMLRIRAVMDASDAWDGYIAPSVGGDGASLNPLSDTRLEILDIPALPSDAVEALTIRVAMCGVAPGWKGASLMRINGAGEDSILLDTSTPATIGTCTTLLASGTAVMFDRVNTVDVTLLGDAVLSNASELAVLNGANAAVIGDEVIQFATATMLSAGKYRLSNLLRGRLGTEQYIGSHVMGERFVLLDSAVLPMVLPTTNIGSSLTLRAATYGATLTSGADVTLTVAGNSLKPLSPVQAKAVKNIATNDVTFSWFRRTRVDGNLRDYVDIPLNETTELYDINVLSGASVVRSWQANAPSQIYTSAEQITDFGALQTAYHITIAQRSAAVGPGFITSGNVIVQ
jgi:hypothetical protein